MYINIKEIIKHEVAHVSRSVKNVKSDNGCIRLQRWKWERKMKAIEF